MSTHPEKPFVCPWWMGYLLASPLRRLLQQPEQILSPYVAPGMTVLEIGPGMGFFTLPLARLVGPGGKIVCVEVQEKMLRSLAHRASRAGLAERIAPVVATEDSFFLESYEGKADFVLLFAVVHEVPDQAKLFREMFRAMKPGAKLLLSEPTGHVAEDAFARSVGEAKAAGFSVVGPAEINRSRSVVLKK
jgi:ubiquinone/menaquinone biosynthesis C-methylase UbiE